MLTKTQLNQLNKILEDEKVRSKGLLKNFIWCNTVKTKYNKGDKVILTDRRLTLSGTPVINFIGIVTEIILFPKEKMISYAVEIKLSNGKTDIDYFQENQIIRKTTSKNLINKVKDNTDKKTFAL